MFFVRQLNENYGVRNRIVILSYALTFALSCMLFELIIFEILDLLQPTYVHYLFFFIYNKLHLINIDHDIFIGISVFIVCFFYLSFLFRFISHIYY